MCSGYIHLHIIRLPMTQIFTTRELLQYGTRAAVDQTLYRMVEAGFINRVARGVFIRDVSYSPPIEEIVEAKMAAWNKTIFTHAENLLAILNLAPKGPKDAHVVAVDGPSSSFETIAGRVELKAIGRRKVSLNQSKVGQIVYALWHLGRKSCAEQEIATATEGFSRSQREELRRATAMMPAWLNDLCRFRFVSTKMPMRC
jgi:hypothetical protein